MHIRISLNRVDSPSKLCQNGGSVSFLARATGDTFLDVWLCQFGMTSKKLGLFSDIDQKGGWLSCRNHYFLKP